MQYLYLENVMELCFESSHFVETLFLQASSPTPLSAVVPMVSFYLEHNGNKVIQQIMGTL